MLTTVGDVVGRGGGLINKNETFYCIRIMSVLSKFTVCFRFTATSEENTYYNDSHMEKHRC